MLRITILLLGLFLSFYPKKWVNDNKSFKSKEQNLKFIRYYGIGLTIVVILWIIYDNLILK